MGRVLEHFSRNGEPLYANICVKAKPGLGRVQVSDEFGYPRLKREGDMKKPISYFIGEGVLIVFSILLALGVNEWRVRASAEADERTAAANILAELSENRSLLDGVPEYHREIGQALFQLLETLQHEGVEERRTPIEIFTSLEMLHESIIISRFPQDVSWQIAKERGVVSRFDYETAKALSMTYEGQREGVVVLYGEIANLLSRSEMFIAKDQAAALAPLAATFSEAASREELLVYLLDRNIDLMIEKYPKAAKKLAID